MFKVIFICTTNITSTYIRPIHNMKRNGKEQSTESAILGGLRK